MTDLRAKVEGLRAATPRDERYDLGWWSAIDAILDMIPEDAVLTTAKCRCSCNCHDEEASPEWPGPCAGCCEPGDNCDCGRALLRLLADR